MMKLSKILLAALLGFATGTACAAQPMTIAKWEQCRDAAELSVSQQEVGIAGVEGKIKQQCGDRPVEEPEGGRFGAVGMHPHDLVRSHAWKNKFLAITKEKYEYFVNCFGMAEGTALEGYWITGERQIKGFR